MRYLDTNVFLRALVQPTTPQDRSKHEACAALLHRVAAGTERVTTCEAVIAEVIYVLTSTRQYGLTHEDASSSLRTILNLRGLHLTHKRAYLRALDLFAAYRHLDFEDALQIAHMERTGERELYSYDRDFDRVAAVTRRQP